MTTTDIIRELNSADEKAIFWRDDSHSPTPTVSDSGSLLSSSSSITSDDINGSPPTRFVSASLFTTIFLQHGHHHNGHKKLNRSQSEPRGRYSRNSGSITSSRYKTELCHPFEENGTCKYGEKCQFAHGFQELRDLARHPKYKTELCRTFHAEGYCPYGTRCHFIHGERNFSKSKPSALCLYPPMSASSVKDLSLSPNSMCSLSPASSMNAFSYTASGSVCSSPPSPTESRLPIFNEIRAPVPALLPPFGRQFGGGVTV